MVTRRVFLRGASLGWVGYGLGAGGVFGQPPAAKKARPAPPGSGPRASEALNRVLAPVRDGRRLPGLIGAVVRGGMVASIGAVGVRKDGAPDPIQVDDQVHIGSDTKAMTATMIGSLVDEGKLGWSATVRDVFPDLAPKLHRDFRAVTLWELITHRAGLPANGPWRDLGRDRSTTDQRRELLTRMMKDAPLTRPGTTFAYSNVGYALAGLMAEQVTGRSWESLMRERLFTPLKMTSAGFGPPGTPGKVDQPWGHRSSGGRLEALQADNAPALGPAGTVHCTVPDWARFAVLHMRAAQRKYELLKPATFRKLHTPPPGQDYAGGWSVTDRDWAGGPALTHSGSNTLWYATVWVAPARNFALLVATNTGADGAADACDQAIQALIKFHLASEARRKS